jgi:diacylglycerol kinase
MMVYVEKMQNRSDVERLEAASEGIKRALLYERPIKIQLGILMVLVIVFAIFFDWSLVAQTLMLGTMIMAVEMINTSIEGVISYSLIMILVSKESKI